MPGLARCPVRSGAHVRAGSDTESPRHPGSFTQRSSCGRLGAMDRTRVGSAAVAGAGATGILLLLLAAVTVFSSFTVTATDFVRPTRTRDYACGSVWKPEDVRNLTPPRAIRVPPPLLNAFGKCEHVRTRRSHRATVELVLGAILVIGALAVPAVSRNLRRRRNRRKRPYTV